MKLDNPTIDDLHRHRRPAMIRRLQGRFGELDAEDLVDEAFTTALAHPERFQVDEGSPEAWINGIAANLARNQRRRNQSAATYDAAQLNPEAQLDHGFEDQVVNAATATVILSTLAAILTDLDANDAAVLNATMLTSLGVYATFPMTSAARVQLHRIRKSLAETLARLHPTDE